MIFGKILDYFNIITMVLINNQNKLFEEFESISSKYYMTIREKFNKNPAILSARLLLEHSIEVVEIQSEDYFITKFAELIHQASQILVENKNREKGKIAPESVPTASNQLLQTMIKILTKKHINRKVLRQTRILIENVSERKEAQSQQQLAQSHVLLAQSQQQLAGAKSMQVESALRLITPSTTPPSSTPPPPSTPPPSSTPPPPAQQQQQPAQLIVMLESEEDRRMLVFF